MYKLKLRNCALAAVALAYQVSAFLPTSFNRVTKRQCLVGSDFAEICPSIPARIRRTGSAITELQSQVKFADAVAEVLKRKFDKSDMKRVLESWYKMEDEYVHRERVEEFDTWQEANSFIPGLPVKAFHDPYEFAWARGLRDNAKIIQDEFQRVAIQGADDLQRRGNNLWIGAANATSYAAYGGDWKTLALMDRCVWDDANVECFPETSRLLRELQVPPAPARQSPPESVTRRQYI